MNKTVRTLLGLLVVGLVTLTSCKQERTEPLQNEGSTYVSVAINLQSSLRAILTTPGAKKIYALINAPEEITKTLEKSMPAHFNEAYAKAVEDMTTAQVARANADKEDLIMMSNSADPSFTGGNV